MKYTWAIIPEEIIVYKFLQTESLRDSLDQTQFHPTTSINSIIRRCEDQINFQICRINLLVVKIKPRVQDL